MSEITPLQEKIPLKFRVHPSFLEDETYVPDPVSIVYTGHHPFKFMEEGYLGGSGLDMWFRNAPFEFTREDAELLIKKGFARLYGENMPHMFS